MVEGGANTAAAGTMERTVITAATEDTAPAAYAAKATAATEDTTHITRGIQKISDPLECRLDDVNDLKEQVLEPA